MKLTVVCVLDSSFPEYLFKYSTLGTIHKLHQANLTRNWNHLAPLLPAKMVVFPPPLYQVLQKRVFAG